ncbi:uncharacterized protein MKK02DRAFT_32078 [Dioszegia hungarica]|uniref:Uncharacterized protein n=1 Tax=Dioszegia hungarica TaxID=4972 RepID=A0AA38HEG4_9TREE|nr:uncharacterized protein MKK02DRAFT_32078 [Dioszegia hungarica]KAI9638690.1 hypothetical protein MKK02DRAFT_32078 [Dioszegia hungarica]
MSEAVKPAAKRRVTAQIPLPSPKLTHGSPSASSPYATPNYPSPAARPTVRARVDPSTSTPTQTSTTRPSLRSSQSSASIRSAVSLPAVPTLARPRSPVNGVHGVKVKSPLLPHTPESTGLSSFGNAPRARVRAPSPGGLASPLNQSYGPNTSTPLPAGGRVRARVANMAGQTDGGKSFMAETETGRRGSASAAISTATPDPTPRPKIHKSQTQPLTTPNPPVSRSRASSIVSSASAAKVRTYASPLPSPALSTSPRSVHVVLDQLQTAGAGPSTPVSTSIVASTRTLTSGLGMDRRRSLSPIPGSGFTHPPASAVGPAALPTRSYPLTPILTPTFQAGPNPLFAQVYNQDPIASCPPSPHHTALPPSSHLKSTGRRMPEYPYTARPGAGVPALPLPLPPEPGVRTVELPLLTPTVTRERERDGEGLRKGSQSGSEVDRRGSAGLSSLSGEGGGVVGLGFDSGFDRRVSGGGGSGVGSGSATGRRVSVDPTRAGVEDGTSAGDRGGAGDVPLRDEGGKREGERDDDGGAEGMTDDNGIVEEARINRKVADLEISNASLLAINRSLEISKSKQRAEILRLRRALRESLVAPLHPASLHPHPSGSSSYFPSSAASSSPGRPYPSPFSRIFPNSPFSLGDGDPQVDEEDGDDHMAMASEAEMEERWKKVEDMMGVMQKRAEGAVWAVQEEMRPAGRTVLGDWGEGAEEGVGEEGGGDSGMGGVGTPERDGEG